MAPPRRVGILALQGAFEEHEQCFQRLPKEMLDRVQFSQVRKAEELDECDALVIPGGESTTMKIIAGMDEFARVLKAFVHGGLGAKGQKVSSRPVWGTCAGCILLADSVSGGGGLRDTICKEDAEPSQKKCKYGESVGGLAITTCRNFFGRQTESFEANLDVDKALDQKGLQQETFQDYPGVFIRAPGILNIGDDVRALARVVHPGATDKEEGVVVAAESDRILVTCFHPELTEDSRIHKYFVEKFVLGAA
jgi:5'-phosphate synthase pdxT subunit